MVRERERGGRLIEIDRLRELSRERERERVRGVGSDSGKEREGEGDLGRAHERVMDRSREDGRERG